MISASVEGKGLCCLSAASWLGTSVWPQPPAAPQLARSNAGQQAEVGAKQLEGSFQPPCCPWSSLFLPWFSCSEKLLFLQQQGLLIFPGGEGGEVRMPVCLPLEILLAMSKTCLFSSSLVQLNSFIQSWLWSNCNSIFQWMKWIPPKISLTVLVILNISIGIL